MYYYFSINLYQITTNNIIRRLLLARLSRILKIHVFINNVEKFFDLILAVSRKNYLVSRKSGKTDKFHKFLLVFVSAVFIKNWINLDFLNQKFKKPKKSVNVVIKCYFAKGLCKSLLQTANRKEYKEVLNIRTIRYNNDIGSKKEWISGE